MEFSWDLTASNLVGNSLRIYMDLWDLMGTLWGCNEI